MKNINNYSILNDLDINTKIVNETSKLNNIKDIKYKFGNIYQYPDLLNNYDYNNWIINLYTLINEKLEDGVVYSMAILGVNELNNKINYTTYGPHVLITKNIDINNLITYIDGQLDSKNLSL
jgi:hypothetical protein